MADRPIIFSAPMVRALLAGTKTQTRRVMPLPEVLAPELWEPVPIGGAGVIDARGHPVPRQSAMAHGKTGRVVLPPYAFGDRLWVREACAIVPRTAYRMSDGVQQTLRPADGHDAAIYREGWERSTGGIRWRSSIHMPRWASRLTLTVTEVRVQRLHDITEGDAMAEGVDPIVDHGVGRYDLYRVAFGQLWDRLHGDGAWDANPWVAAVGFTVGRHNIDTTAGP